MNFDRPILTVNLGIIQQNYLSICSLLQNSKVAAVIKADSYGVGSKQVVPCLFAAGCRDFIVFNIDEAIIVRESVNSLDTTEEVNIYVLGGVFSSTKELFHQYNIIPVINHIEQLKIWQNVKNPHGIPNKTVLHLDTGMNRLGMKNDDIEMICSSKIDLSNLDIIMLMSHLAASDEPENPSNQIQLERFLELCTKMSFGKNKIKRSISNSGGVFLGQQYHLDMVRAGGALVGLHTHPSAERYIKNPLKLTAPIMQLQNISKGDKIGYNGAYVSSENMKIATIPVGYADGFHCILGNRGNVYIDSIKAPIVGRVSMDLMTIDVTHIPEDNLFLGKEVELIGSHQTPDQLAKDTDFIGYEMITSLGNRYSKVYTNPINANLR